MVKKLNYIPSPYMSKDSHYDEVKADRAVNFIRCLSHTKGQWAGRRFDLLPWQEKIIRDLFGTIKPDGYRQFNTAYIEIPKKNGKALILTTPIFTPHGWSTMGELKVGDEVFDETGHPCHIVAKSEIIDNEQAYKLAFRDGSEIIAGENHLWDVENIWGKRTRHIWKTKEIYERAEKHKLTKDSVEASRSVIRIPVTQPLEMPEAVLPVDPYLYGYWLGNGESTSCNITVSNCDVEDMLNNIPYKAHHYYPQKCGGSYKLVYKELKPILVKHFREKVIRPEYLIASKEQRLALLQGLMDSDGCIGTVKHQSVYVSTIKQLAESVRELLWSLGYKNSMTEEPSTRYGKPTGETLYTIRFTALGSDKLSRLKRKDERRDRRNGETRSSFHYLRSIEPLDHKVEMQCIQVDSTSHCYLAGKSMVPTHNSELAAAVALLLLCGDNEERAEVYGCAADRQQASIVFEVAADMVRMCPALNRRCKILTAQKRLIFQPTNSTYQVLSAEAYSKHGFNISGVVFDELHTQPDRRLFDVMTKGSGDARTQPLYFLITTAGTDTKSICYEQHQKAQDIIDGRKHDKTYYPVIYGAGIDDDWTSPKVWAKANPSLGYTIALDKVKAACESAKETPTEENAFRQLRLNQWVKQAVRWMQMSKWDACGEKFDPKMLEGRVCYGGLDLSSTTDITAFSLVFPPTEEDDKFYVLPYFWIPEEAMEARVLRDKVPYDMWVRQGLIEATDGNVIHYDFVEHVIEELGQRYNIREIAFDRWGATQMAQNLENGGFTVVPFGQGFQSMSPPTKELYNLVLEGRIAHGGNEVLRWMMDNVCVRRDPANNIKMDKEKSTEKIDGAIATVMALDRAIRCGNDNSESVYEDRGLFVL